jgi:hypothetical protein
MPTHELNSVLLLGCEFTLSKLGIVGLEVYAVGK